jgi:hypothetical protein
MNIAFWDNTLCERGTTVSLYDYAYYNENFFGNKSFIFYLNTRIENNIKVIERFNERFVVHGVDNFEEVDNYLIKYNITHIYIIKGGEIDSRLSKVAKNCIHCAFNCEQPHGDVYSVISPCVKGYNTTIPIVPHMINLPNDIHDDMRETLNIPKNAIVFGGYGGKDSFSIKFVQKIVYKVAKTNPNIYFLFANFNKFCPIMKNIIHLDTITDLKEKTRFINTIDAMLWARIGGESFGIAIGEFSSKNKPIIATKNGYLSHANILKDKALWYSNNLDLTQILLNFDPIVEREKDWNAYKDYTPEKIMEIFKKTYLD